MSVNNAIEFRRDALLTGLTKLMMQNPLFSICKGRNYKTCKPALQFLGSACHLMLYSNEVSCTSSYYLKF